MAFTDCGYVYIEGSNRSSQLGFDERKDKYNMFKMRSSKSNKPKLSFEENIMALHLNNRNFLIL